MNRQARDAELSELGWKRRFIGAPPRLAEVSELYESLGLEVFFDSVTEQELAEECAGCALALNVFRVVYTRRGT